MTGVIINIFVLIAFLTFAYYLSKGKGAFLLSGYNTMSEEKKAKLNELALSKFMSKIMYGLSFCVFLFALSDIIDQPILFVVGLVLFILLVVFAVVYSNTGKRFEK